MSPCIGYVQKDATTPNIVGLTMLGVVASVGAWLKVWPVSNFAQQLPTTRNNMQQGVQTNATCNIQQSRELLANNVASVWTGLFGYDQLIFKVYPLTWDNLSLENITMCCLLFCGWNQEDSALLLDDPQSTTVTCCHFAAINTYRRVKEII